MICLLLTQMSSHIYYLTFYISEFHIAYCEHNIIVHIAPYWSALLDFIVQSVSINAFCNNLIKIDFSKFLKIRPIKTP